MTWRCDVCGGAIEKVEAGWVEWVVFPKEGGGRGARDLRLVHHLRCMFDDRVERARDGGSLRDNHLSAFLGPNGLVHLLRLPVMYPGLDCQEVISLIQRLHVPNYEQARPYFAEAIANGDLDRGYEPGLYTQTELKYVIGLYGR